MYSFSERLKSALAERGLTQAELSRLSGIGRNSINDYLKNKYEAKQDKVYLLAKALNVNEAWLMGYDVPKERIEELEVPAKETDIKGFVDNDMDKKHSKIITDTIELPFYPSIAAGALAEMESVDVWNVEKIDIPIVMLDVYANSKNLFSMKVNGDSMDNVIPSGSLIIVKPIEHSLYKDGDIVVFSYENEYSLKRFRPNMMKGFVVFEPDSKNSDFENIPISKDEGFDANIYGKVIFTARTF